MPTSIQPKKISESKKDTENSPFYLLKENRFLPFFITQTLGALNDNIFKNALVILIIFKNVNAFGLDSKLLVTAAAVIFILPFFLFSATAGQFADKYEKSRSIRWIKLAEIFIMILACIGLYIDNTELLLIVLFLLGLQSTVFGPIKYGLLPQHLTSSELVGGNALVESSTFLAILIGTIIGGAIAALKVDIVFWLSLSILMVSIFGYLASLKIPVTPAVDPHLTINRNLLNETVQNLKSLVSNNVVFRSALGISWFWFYGAVFLAQIASYTQYSLSADETVATLLLAVFSFGIGIGSILCHRLSNGRVEIGLVPIGAIGLSVFAVDLYYASLQSPLNILYTWQSFLSNSSNWRILLDFGLIGVFGGIFTVPLYSLIQQRSKKSHLSRVIAGNNILNALFMVISGLFSMLLFAYDFSIPQLFLITGIINLFVAIYVFTKAPEFIARFITWCLINSIYRIKPRNLHLIPKQGGCVIVSNHVSFVDALIIAGYCKRNIKFVMDHKIFNLPIIGRFFKMIGAIPIASTQENKKIKMEAFDQIASALKHGEVVCIFPEGKLTVDGSIGEFKKGIELIIKRSPVQVIPIALKGLWGNWFSRKNGPAMTGIPKMFMSKIELNVGIPINAQEVNCDRLRNRVLDLYES